MWHTQGRKDELTSCRGTAQSAWQYLQWVAKEGEPPGCPKRVSGRHVVRGRHPSPIPAQQPWVRQGDRQGWWKRSKFRWGGRQLSLDKTVGSRVWRHTQGSSGRPASDQGWGSSSKTAPRSLSTRSPAGRTPPHGDGSMYSQANVRVGKCAAAAYPSVAVRDRGHWRGVAGSGWVRGAGRGKTARGWKGVRPWVRLENWTVMSRWGARRTQAPMDKNHKDPDWLECTTSCIVPAQCMEETSRRSVLGRHQSCYKERIEVLSDSIERYHSSWNPSSLLYSEGQIVQPSRSFQSNQPNQVVIERANPLLEPIDRGHPLLELKLTREPCKMEGKTSRSQEIDVSSFHEEAVSSDRSGQPVVETSRTPYRFIWWQQESQRWNGTWSNLATRCKPRRFKSWANNAERGEHGLPNSRVTTFCCEACTEHKRSRIDLENREPPRSTCSSTRSTTKQSLQPVQCEVKADDSGRGQHGTVWIARDGHQNAVQSMLIILKWRHCLLYMWASLKRNSGQSTFHCIYDGPSFNSRIRHQEGKTSWPQIWETSRRQRISSGP